MSFVPGGLIVDMDGVLFHGTRPMPGLVELFAALATRPYVLVTNNSRSSRLDCQALLRGMGVDLPAEVILTASDAAGRYLADTLPAGSRAQVLGSAALRVAVEQAGMTLVDRDADVVVAGLDRDFSYASLMAAVRAVAAGARYVATSLDAVLLQEDGIAPGAGAMIAAINACVTVRPVCVGKPNPAMFAVAAGQLGLPAREILVVGDNLAVDIAWGASAGARTALLLTGVSGRDDRAQYRPDYVLPGLPELTDFLAQACSPS